MPRWPTGYSASSISGGYWPPPKPPSSPPGTPPKKNDQNMLIDLACSLSHDDFTRALTHWKRCADPDGPQPGELHGELNVHTHPDSRVTIHGDLDSINGTTFTEALTRIERQLFLTEWNHAKAIWGDNMCADRLTRTPITVRQLADLLLRSPIDRTFINITLEPSSQRSFTGRLRRYLDVRDRRCRWPGCHQPAQRCQGDHITPHHRGGPTSPHNGQLLCGPHNRTKDPTHGPNFTVTHTTFNTLTYQRPDGTPIPTTSTLGQPRPHPRGETHPP